MKPTWRTSIVVLLLVAYAAAQAADLGSDCTDDKDCGENTFCDDLQCACKDDFVNNAANTTCLEVVEKYGDPCEEPAQCESLSPGGKNIKCEAKSEEDPDLVCKCVSSMHYRNGDCWDDIEFGEVCANTDECITTHAICLQGVCKCGIGYLENEDKCEPGIESICADIEGAEEDENGFCSCTEHNYIISSSRSRCIKVVFGGYHAACEESTQCIYRMGPGSSCTAGECQCEEGYHYLHGKCWKTRVLGETCAVDDDCYAYRETDSFVCVDKKCECAPGAYQPRDDMCRRLAYDGEECESNLDCDTGLLCVVQSTLDSICVPNTTANAYDTMGLSFRNWVPTLPLVEEDTDCRENGELIASDCVCKPGYYESGGACVPELGEACYNVSDCAAGIVYVSCRRSARSQGTGEDDQIGVCACQGGFAATDDNRECTKTRIIGFNCETDARCAYYGAICVSGSCTCPQEYHYVEERDLCMPSKGLGDVCEEVYDCDVATSSGVECTAAASGEETTCRCKDKHHQANGDCRPDPEKLGDTCTEATDCTNFLDIPWTTCTSSKCACQTYYFQKDDSCTAGVGAACEKNQDCSAVTNSLCDNAVCQCKEGFVRSRDYSRCLPVQTEYGGSCEVDDQCSNIVSEDKQYFMTCDYKSISEPDNYICRCFDTYHYKNGDCWIDVALGQECQYASVCVANNSVCRKSYCECDTDYHAVGSECVSDSGAASVGKMTFTAFLFVQIVVLLSSAKNRT